MKPTPQVVDLELTVAEEAASRQASQSDLATPDPASEAANAAIENNSKPLKESTKS